MAEGHWKPKTKAWYETGLRVHVLPRWGDVQVGTIDRREVEEWTRTLETTLAPATVRGVVATLRALLEVAVRAGTVAVNPCRAVRLPRLRQREVLCLSAEQIESLANAMDRPEHALLIRLAAWTGLRAGELGALRRSRLDLRQGVLRVEESLADVRGNLIFGPPKTYQRRAVPVPKPLLPDLKVHLASSVGPNPDALVFAGPDGKPMSHRNFYRATFKPALVRAGIPSETRFHDLRHTFAALLIAQGAHPRAIMERMGHSTVNITIGTYGHLLPGLEAELTDRLGETLATARASTRDAYRTQVARPTAAAGVEEDHNPPQHQP